MSKIIVSEFGGTVFQFDDNGWFNATGAAASYGKRPVDWLKQVETKKYIDAMCRKSEVTENHFVKTFKGGDLSIQGTWFHPKLAVMFTRWLDVDFSIWCDEQIDAIIRGVPTQQFAIWKELQTAISKNEGSFIRASFGARLMLDRKRDKPNLEERISILKSQIQPSLFTQQPA